MQAPFGGDCTKVLTQKRQYFCQLESPLSLCREIQSMAQKLKSGEQKMFKIIRLLILLDYQERIAFKITQVLSYFSC